MFLRFQKKAEFRCVGVWLVILLLFFNLQQLSGYMNVDCIHMTKGRASPLYKKANVR
jgi:hypothetical protein